MIKEILIVDIIDVKDKVIKKSEERYLLKALHTNSIEVKKQGNRYKLINGHKRVAVAKSLGNIHIRAKVSTD